MKKKKQRQSAAGTSTATNAEEIESAVHSHAEFFDRLIELIPKKFYHNEGESNPWHGGLSKKAKAYKKKQSKENIKLARLQRFDPDHKDEDIAVVKPNVAPEIEDKEKSITYEEMRQKLRRKIELMRGNRGEGARRFDGGRKRKFGGEDGEGASVMEHSEEEEIEYGKVRLDEDEGGKKKKKRKLSKVQELEKAKRLQELKKEKPSEVEKEAWKAATDRAMGVKVHDNPRLIKESLKKGKKKKEKNAEKWKERVETQAKFKEDRQKKRKDNIDGRIQDKKMRKIAKREKKLLRPGFEGRKEGFITKE